jgi:hypothetical protein
MADGAISLAETDFWPILSSRRYFSAGKGRFQPVSFFLNT